MKHFLLSSLLLSLFALSACDSKDNITSNPLKGTWYLVQPDTSGKVKWIFSDTSIKIINDDPTNTYIGFDSGTYPYSLFQSENGSSCPETIMINENYFGCYYIINKELHIKQVNNYGPNFKLIKS